ncbi:hypothetical protein Tcan_13381 [Toxocara canis]|uniref:Uncharacterized protein n=1 Tax=Toxocara canis TaxID=6265 RepID=A0A0B2V175_TOXCA|nr:hypothetical protein Tcan_13381 [Toxocara canis]
MQDVIKFSADLAWSRPAVSCAFLNLRSTLISASTCARHPDAFRPPTGASCSVWAMQLDLFGNCISSPIFLSASSKASISSSPESKRSPSEQVEALSSSSLQMLTAATSSQPA